MRPVYNCFRQNYNLLAHRVSFQNLFNWAVDHMLNGVQVPLILITSIQWTFRHNGIQWWSMEVVNIKKDEGCAWQIFHLGNWLNPSAKLRWQVLVYIVSNPCRKRGEQWHLKPLWNILTTIHICLFSQWLREFEYKIRILQEKPGTTADLQKKR